MTTQTTQARLTAASAIRYVHDYFVEMEDQPVCVTSVSSHYPEDDVQFINVSFERLGRPELFTVWQQSDGSLYGEW